VTNRSARILTPRFQVRHSSVLSMLPWTIVEGPDAVPPGGSALYRIASERDEATFFNFETAQVFVTDANADYDLTGSQTIPADRTYQWPDAIANPTFGYWPVSGDSPLFWFASHATGYDLHG
jgi:hypothetical protein